MSIHWDHYYMAMAVVTSIRANCLGRKVGAIIVKGNRVISTGYNGTPEGMANCDEGGCVRCRHRDQYSVGERAYDLCICVHAEQNALLSAARFGVSVEGGTLYSTVRPCFNCSKEAVQAKIERVVYMDELGDPHPNPEIHAQYEEIQREFELCKIERSAVREALALIESRF